MKKWIYIVLSVLVLGFVGYQWYGSKTSSQEISAQVRTAVVQKGKLEVKISGSGTVQPVTSEDIKSTMDNNEIGIGNWSELASKIDKVESKMKKVASKKRKVESKRTKVESKRGIFLKNNFKHTF